MSQLIDVNSSRAKQARLAKMIGKTGYTVLLMLAMAALISGIGLYVTGTKSLAYLLLALAVLFYMPAAWWKRHLSVLRAQGNELNERLPGDVLAKLKGLKDQDSVTVWEALADHWQARFLLNHMLLTKELVSAHLNRDRAQLEAGLKWSAYLADKSKSKTIEVGFVVAGLMLASPPMRQLMVQFKAQPEDIESAALWLGRALDDEQNSKRSFGGIGRDWAFGFTPLLNRFGHNISRSIMNQGAHFDWLAESEGVRAIETAFNNRTAAVALIGPEGIGKTTSIYALAQRLIEGNTGRTLAYHQIIGINATQIVSTARGPGDLENIMLSLAAEAGHAGHVILFFDDAQLFFDDTPGSFDATHILQSIVQARPAPVILAMSPADFQRLKSRNQSLASLLTPVMLNEPAEEDVLRILEDIALGLEMRHSVLIGYEALHEAYRLSGRYEQDEAYPGKAIKLLEQAVSHSEHSVVSANSVQKAVEQTRGVKATSAAPAEADKLLHLEDMIHERMINQTQAVNVVSNALRRARAGVTNPKRPIGSFLFLGPTGVGKTELAKAIAATYFGSETTLIRLDMSEYQQPDDVQRLLATGQNETSSLLLQVRQQPFSVVLLDEIEKAHPNILNLLLQLLDEGQLTDLSGRTASFKDCVIIATSNAGAQSIREKVAQGESLESFSSELTDELINKGQFKPELLNRFDDMVLFRPLNPDELAQVVRLMLAEVNKTLTNQNISLDLTDAAIAKIVEQGNDPRLGARPMRRTLQRAVEDTVAQKILKGETRPGDKLTLDVNDLQFS